MLAVVLDTSTAAVTAALVRVGSADIAGTVGSADIAGTVGTADIAGKAGVELIAERRSVDARAHGELLAPAVVDVLHRGHAGPRDLAAVVAGLGPGPFTGLRVGLVTAASMAQALAIPTYGVCSLDGIGSLTSGTTLVATDARRKEVYWAVYVDGTRVTEPAVNRPDDVPVILADRGLEVSAAIGDGALRYAGALALPVRDDPRYPSPPALAGLAAERILARAPGEVLTPLYLRRPDAVELVARKPVSR